jgi:diaminopimelate epimerase
MKGDMPCAPHATPVILWNSKESPAGKPRRIAVTRSQAQGAKCFGLSQGVNRPNPHPFYGPEAACDGWRGLASPVFHPHPAEKFGNPRFLASPCVFGRPLLSSASMWAEFTKMNGAGNDFILFDNRTGSLKLTPEQITRLCDRHAGIGADGIIILVPCKSGAADWAWDFYNSDGSPAEMCGNGARCFARFVQRLTGEKKNLTFETKAGVISASFAGERVTINLTAPKDLKISQPISLSIGKSVVHSVNTGVPHAVLFVDDTDKAMVTSLGSELRYHSGFAPRGTNVNFVQVRAPNAIRVRTYERGVEGETLACGTGVSASALIAAELNGWQSPVNVEVRSGERLEVSFEKKDGQFGAVRLTGPADFVFEGKIQL